MRLLALMLFVSCLQAAEPHETPLENRDHWAWQPVTRDVPPDVRRRERVTSPIDRFILARCELSGLESAAVASKEQLIRRVSFDLIGLPPELDDIDAFLQDQSPDAWEKLIDRLLLSPLYGERWGRHWLDLARYADSNGYEYDEIRPDAWRYRDYVINSFNSDKPYTRFITEQIAGDELYPEDTSALIATGFNLMGPDMTDSSDQVQRRQNTLNDMTDTMGLVFLGLTIGCARCHDHKFEPFPQVDYYRMQAFFTPATFRHNLNIVPLDQRMALADAIAQYEAERSPIQAERDLLEQPYRSTLRAAKLARQSEEVRAAHETPEAQRTPAERERVAETLRFVEVQIGEIVNEMNREERLRHRDLSERLIFLNARKPQAAVAMGLRNTDNPVRTFMLEQGDPAEKGQEVEPGILAVLPSPSLQIPASPSHESPIGPRAALAGWLADELNPLTARVMVNRLWHYHFGRGIVGTPSDFGVRGERPTHPELLDWLAHDFMRGHWSIKRMHRSMLASTTYQQSTSASAAVMKSDPENRLLARSNRRRIEGEVIRDSLLAVSGLLTLKQGGPGIATTASSEDKGARRLAATTDKSEHTRRSIYLLARRNLRNPFLEAFDLPDSNLSCSERGRSTTAPQALALFNDDDVVAAANAMAAALNADRDPVTTAYRLILARRPSGVERELALSMLVDSPLSELCRALFNVNEFIYVD